MQTEDSIRETLKTVKYPGYSRDIVSFGLVKQVKCNSGAVAVMVEMTSHNAEVAEEIRKDAEGKIKALDGIDLVHVEVKMPAQGQAPQAPQGGVQRKVSGIKRVIAVASGKGGVGKSTMSVNLACALKHLGHKVGLLDCDIYGPSVPLMMGRVEKPNVSADEKLIPIEAHGVSLMSMGFIVDGDNPVIWRGPMIQKTIQQFIYQVDWGELDFLLVDLPPGTGDAQLSLCQSAPIDGGVIVTTPQEASLGVVRKGIGMFEKVNVPIIGIVENMSHFTTPSGERFEIFGNGGGKAEAERKDVPFLGDVPIFMEVREAGDNGTPVVVSAPDSVPGKAMLNVGENVLAALDKK